MNPFSAKQVIALAAMLCPALALPLAAQAIGKVQPFVCEGGQSDYITDPSGKRLGFGPLR